MTEREKKRLAMAVTIAVVLVDNEKPVKEIERLLKKYEQQISPESAEKDG